jgi:hypothetical protein
MGEAARVAGWNVAHRQSIPPAGTNLVLGTGEAGLNGKILQVARCRL